MFFDVLQSLCDEKGIAMSALLDNVGMSRGNIARWKNGLAPKPATKMKLAEALGVDRSRLDEKENADPIPSDEIGYNDFSYALYHESKELTPENQEKLLEMARFFKHQQDQGK